MTATHTREQIEADLRDAVLHVQWLERKLDGLAVAERLDPLPAGFEFSLSYDAGRAYRALYRKNAEGLWDQVPGTCESPHVRNLAADHLGFAVGARTIVTAVDARLGAEAGL